MYLPFLAAGFVSILSLSGAFALLLRPDLLRKLLLFFVAFSAGAMMGGAFFHLLPEAIALFPVGSLQPFFILSGGFCLFFILERFVFWHHCHNDEGCKVHPLGDMNLVGDGVHNFMDGLLIAAAFGVSTELGIATTIAIISHEIPQEISDFGVLIHSGMSAKKALFFNFVSALTALLGVFIGVLFAEKTEIFQRVLIAFAAGGFLYIAASDLVPELHKEENVQK